MLKKPYSSPCFFSLFFIASMAILQASAMPTTSTPYAACYSGKTAVKWIKSGIKYGHYKYALFMLHPQDMLTGGVTYNQFISVLRYLKAASPQNRAVPAGYSKYCFGTISQVAEALGYLPDNGYNPLKKCMSQKGFPIAMRLDDIQGGADIPGSYPRAIETMLKAFAAEHLPVTVGFIGSLNINTDSEMAICNRFTSPYTPKPLCKKVSTGVLQALLMLSNKGLLEAANHSYWHQDYISGRYQFYPEGVQDTETVINTLKLPAAKVFIPPENVIHLKIMKNALVYNNHYAVISTQCPYTPDGIKGTCIISPGASGQALYNPNNRNGLKGYPYTVPVTATTLYGVASLPVTAVFGDTNWFQSFTCKH